MQAFRQPLPNFPAVPTAKALMRQSKLVLSEGIEAVRAAAVTIRVKPGVEYINTLNDLILEHSGEEVSLAALLKEYADCSVVATGSIIACGVPVEPILTIVDTNNLARSASGHHDEDGKFHKSPDAPKAEPVINAFLTTLVVAPRECWASDSNNGVIVKFSSSEEANIYVATHPQRVTGAQVPKEQQHVD